MTLSVVADSEDNAMALWKEAERKIAKHIGGKRVPITGRQRGDVPDVAHEWLSVEIKHRKKLPEWIKDGMTQAVAAQQGEQLPVLILHQKYQPYLDSMICMKLRDFLEWFGGDNVNVEDIASEIEEESIE